MSESSQKSTRVWRVTLVVLLLIAAFLIGSLSTEVRYLKKTSIATDSGTKNSPTGPDADAVLPLQDRDHVRGDRQAQVLLIEYSDLECPYCKRFHPTAQQTVNAYEGAVAWVYRHFPLDQIHSKADKEAEATECAGELGGEEGFWSMADKIYEVTPSNNGLNLEDLPMLAGEIGLNAVQFKECLASGKYAERVEKDYQSGLKAGVSGTPGNILLNTKTGRTRTVPGAVPFEQLKSAIDAFLAES